MRTLISLLSVAMLFGRFIPCLAQPLPPRPQTLGGLLNSTDEPQGRAEQRAPEKIPPSPSLAIPRSKNGLKHPDLDKAWGEYEAAVEKATNKLKAALTKQFDAATTKGDLDAAEKWQSAVERFTTRGEVPDDGAMQAAVQAAVVDCKKSREVLLAVYDAVIKSLTKDKRITEAKLAKEEIANASDAWAAQGQAKGVQAAEPRIFTFDLRQPVAENTRQTNAAIHKEPFGAIVYWAPQETGKWATISYKLAIPFPIGEVELRGVGVNAWNRHADVAYDPDAIAILEAAPDGQKWTLIWSSTPEKGIERNDEWIEAVRGSKELHLQARLFAQRRTNRNVHHVQFLRSEPERGKIPQVIVRAEDSDLRKPIALRPRELRPVATEGPNDQPAQPVNPAKQMERPVNRRKGTLARPRDGIKHPDLNKGWAGYEQSIAQATVSIKAGIAEQFDAATARGDLDGAEKCQMLLEKFEKAGELPNEKETKTAVTAALAKYGEAMDKLAKTYENVVKSFTVENRLLDASAVKKEFDNVLRQEQPPRTLDNLLGEPAEKAPLAPPAEEAVAGVDLLAVPPEAEVTEAIILIRDVYADEYKAEPGVLIKTLKSAAFQTDDAVRKFALLQEAEKAAVKAGDPSKAFELLEKRGSLFEIDVQQSSIALLKKFPKLPGQTTKKLIEISLQISRTALGADQFPAAKDAVEVAVGKARDLSQEERDKKIKGLGGEALRNEATALQKDITLRSKIFGEYQEAVATLKKAGAGACEQEHGVAGRYLCLSKDDWDAGVTSLAKGEAGPLQVAASKELMQKSGGQNLPKELLAVAGEWWNLSEKPTVTKPPLSESDLEKIREHWGSLYAEALPHLIDPIDRKLATKRSTGAGAQGPKKRAGNGQIIGWDKKKIVLGRLEADGDSDFTQGEYLTPDSEVTASQRNHALRFTKGGSLVLYNKQTRKILWSVGFEGSGASLLIVQDDGNIVLSRPDGIVIWASDSRGGRGSHLAVQDDGNLVVYVGKSVQWASNTQGQ